jgi:hypothetical protein
MSTRGHFAFWSLFILALPVLGQRPSRSGIGLKVGPQGTNLLGSDKVYKPIPGVVSGIYFPLWVGARFELQPELLLSYQGSQLPDAENGPGRMRMLYLCLPLNAKLYISNALNIQGGVQESRILKATIDTIASTDRFRAFDFGFTAGVGLDLYTGLDMTVRYYAGMSPVLLSTTGVNPRNRLLQFTVGYRVARLRHNRNRRG